jgi:hypothetical protein
MKEATVLDPYIDYRLYREKMDRVDKRLELLRQLPERERRRLPQVSFSFVWQRLRQGVAQPGGC